MVLVTGPTGSGKTTTLYSALSELNKISENISTAEDPVEFNLAGINQVQMHEDIGLNFAAALRAFLRQDPDIIMVGEIRDFETAEIAVKAALTGHLVLSTLHTNDAPVAPITRLLNMGVEPFLVAVVGEPASSPSASRAGSAPTARSRRGRHRARRCIDAGPRRARGRAASTLVQGRGCRNCNDTGYKGRVALYEVMPFGDELKELVLQRRLGGGAQARGDPPRHEDPAHERRSTR